MTRKDRKQSPKQCFSCSKNLLRLSRQPLKTKMQSCAYCCGAATLMLSKPSLLLLLTSDNKKPPTVPTDLTDWSHLLALPELSVKGVKWSLGCCCNPSSASVKLLGLCSSKREHEFNWKSLGTTCIKEKNQVKVMSEASESIQHIAVKICNWN